MTVAVSNFFSHPLPKALDGVKVRTVSGQRLQVHTQRFGPGHSYLGPMPRSTVPNDHDLGRRRTDPLSHSLQKGFRGRAITRSFVPNQTSTSRKVVRPEPVDALRQAWAITHTPSTLAFGGPHIAQVHVSVEMSFVDVDQQHFVGTDFLVQPTKFLEELFSLGGTPSAQKFLDFFPRISSPSKNVANRAARNSQAESLSDPSSELLERRAVSGQAVVNGFGFVGGLQELVFVVSRKRGRRPPVRL